jgi:hypothetical protein
MYLYSFKEQKQNIRVFKSSYISQLCITVVDINSGSPRQPEVDLRVRECREWLACTSTASWSLRRRSGAATATSGAPSTPLRSTRSEIRFETIQL